MSALQGLLLALCICCPLVLGVIVDRRVAEDLVEPMAVEISPDDHLGSFAESVLGSDFTAARSKRQFANGTDFGTTVRLNGTNRHYFALVHWTGHPSEVLFIVTMTRRNDPSDSCLWRSTDYGMTFTNDSYKFNDSSAVISWYYVSPFDQYIVMTDTRQNKIFVTRDEGVTFEGRELDFKPNKIRFQGRTVPNSDKGTLPQHIMGYETDTQSLYVSKDLGDTWVFLGGNISRYRWRVLDEEFESNTSLYFEKDINDTHAVLMTSRDPYSEAETMELDPGLGPIKINSTVLNHEYILVQRITESNPVPLWVSAYRRPFRQAVFLEPMKQAHYAVMDASEHRVFLAVEHANSSDIHLYTSDAEGVSYTLSLDNVVATEDWGNDDNPSFDIHVVEGMDGVYMVNVYDGDNVKTVITYNKGSRWRSLAAPPVGSDGQPTLCLPGCSLHLRMDTDTPLGYSSISSKRSAVGLIMAQGNVGEGLRGDGDLLGMYISRDGGFSWSQVERGHWTFQMVTLGSIIVMAPKKTTVDPLNFVVWSCDEGVTWTHYVFTTTPMRLIGLLSQKGEKSRRVTLFGYLRGVSPFSWLIVDLDFSVAVPDQCSYPDDYFEWLPSDGRTDRRCVLGVEKTYERRNSTACCYIDPEFVRAIDNVSCSCSREDYECDVGYRLEAPGGRCVDGFPPPPDNCTEGAYYLSPSGYRKVVGDVCTDLLGSQFLAGHVPCPPVVPEGLGMPIMGGPSAVFLTNSNITFVITQQLGWVKSTSYTWDFGDGIVISGSGLESMATQTHSYHTTGRYTISVLASNPAGSSSIKLEIFIGGFPVLKSLGVAGDVSEAGNTLNFTLVTDMTFATYYIWDFGDSSPIVRSEDHFNVEMQSKVYAGRGIYTVTVTAYNTYGINSTSMMVYVGAPKMLTISMSGDKSRAGSNITFTLMLGEGAASTYVWDFGDGTPAMRGTRSSTSHTYQQTGVYTLQATATNPVGSESTSVEIYIGAPEIHSVKVNGDYSEPGNDITITVTIGEGSATMYEWDLGDGRVETTSGHDRVEVLTHSYVDHGVYTVWVTASNPIGKSSMSVVVHIGEVLAQGLSIGVQGDQSKAGQELTFSLTQEKGLTEETVYTWDFGDESDEVEIKGLEAAGTQRHTYASDGHYTVRVTASNEGGRNSIVIDVTVGTPPPPGKGKLTGSDDKEEKRATGLGVGLVILFLVVILVAGAFIIVFFWYRKRYTNLEGQYKALREGTTGDLMALSISASELQEDFGYSKDSEADDRCLVSDDGEL